MWLMKCSFLIGLVCLAAVADADEPILYNIVAFRNSLKSNKLLKLDCSKGNAVNQGVSPGKFYRFRVDDNLWGTNKVNCLLRQGPRWEHHQDFEAYWTNFWRSTFKKSGVMYSWDVREDGIYFARDRDLNEANWGRKAWKRKYTWL